MVGKNRWYNLQFEIITQADIRERIPLKKEKTRDMRATWK